MNFWSARKYKRLNYEDQPQLILAQYVELIGHSLRPSSTSNSSSSSNNFKRRAYCSSLFFFCHNLNRKKTNNKTTRSTMTIMATVEREPLGFTAALDPDESSEAPVKRCPKKIKINQMIWSVHQYKYERLSKSKGQEWRV